MAIPKTFTGGERLFAEDLNSNFEALDTRLATAEGDLVASGNIDNVVVTTQSGYDGLTPNARTLYIIVG